MAKNPWDDKWVRDKLLGGGGQGQTFLVSSKADGSPGVMKLLVNRRKNDPASRRRMHLEVTNLQFVGAAGGKVPKVLDFNTITFANENEELYFVMEFIDGPTLREVVTEGKPLSLDDSMKVVRSLCETLKVAFEGALVHRDIKPENIIVRGGRPDDSVMVDFGLSFNAEVEGPSVTNETFDNFFISLPERRGPNENRRDPRSDLTGVCAIFHFCLTGCIPRDLRDSANRPPHRRPGYELGRVTDDRRKRNLLESFFDRGFQVESALRFQTLAELLGRIDEIASDTSKGPLLEDLTTVAKREAERLFLADRRSQLAAFRSKTEPLVKRFTAVLNATAKKLRETPNFNMEYGNTTINPREVPDEGTPIVNQFLYTFRYAHSPIRVRVAYALIAIGNEAALYRRSYRMRLDPEDKWDRVADIFENWTVLCRYPAIEETPPSVLESDFEEQSALAIARLSEEIHKELREQ